jgi:hypothetical protein
MTAARFNIIVEQDAIDTAVARYLDEHPDLDPDRISVNLRPTSDGLGYLADGHTVLARAGEADRDEPAIEELARAAFGAYANWHGHTNHTMDVAEGWDNQGPDIVAGFNAAAKVVRDMLLGQP